MLLRLVLAIWPIHVTNGDGPVATTTTADSGSGNSGLCNPFDGYRYISIGAASGIQSTQCTASWDLYEVEVSAEGNWLWVTGSSPTGSDSNHPASYATDRNTGTFWAGDHDIGMSCSCWADSKKDGQLLVVDLGRSYSVYQIRIYQGGTGDLWAVNRIRRPVLT